MRILSTASFVGAASLVVLAANLQPALAVLTDLQLPGTQPYQAMLLGGLPTCDGCHGYYNPAVEPVENWMGGMMAQAGRDPVFWATLAVAESDFPGAGDFCLRCHTPRAWHEGRAIPSDGSMLNSSTDSNGVECAICHNLVNPNTQEHAGIQNAPYEAHDGGTPPNGYNGSGMMVLAGNQTRYGPYATTTAGHAFAQSQFHRSSDMCGTCHDVSNPVVGDLAPGNGAQVPLAPGTYSGVVNTPVTTKAAFNNFPFQYGIVERTFSEHKASAFPTLPVSSYNTLPADLQRGAIARARSQALLAGQNGNYEDGTTRYFTCQSCHMEPVVGEGTAFGISPLRYDLPMHDMTGGNTWVPDAIRWLDGQNRLTLGGGITQNMSAAMDRGILRARASLKRAAALDVDADSVRITNLTGHKLISGYPEGRRMWLRTTWKDEAGTVLRQDGSYGSFQSNVNGTNYTVSSITDPNARVYEAKMGISQDWALQLLTLGVPATLPLSFDRTTGAVTMTLVQLASAAPGTTHESFHFVLNNTLIADNRIPPYGFRYNDAQTRNALPVPATQFGNPGQNGIYDHFDDVPLNPPAGATRAEIELLYQTSSWEYIQFLRLANPGTNAFLQNKGIDLFDAWRNTGQSAPEQMALARWCDLPGTGEDLVLESGINGATPDATCGKQVLPGDTVTFRTTSPNGTFAANLGAIVYQLHDASAPPTPVLPGIWLNRADASILLVGATPAGTTTTIVMPSWVPTVMVRAQAAMLSPNAANGTYAASNALDVWVQ
jgi:hypothetical protein